MKKIFITILVLFLYPYVEAQNNNNIEPVASFYNRFETVEVGQTQMFVSTSTDEDGSIEEFSWKVDKKKPTDHDTSRIFYTFTKPGKIEVELEVKDDKGKKDKITKMITVVKENSLPVVEIKYKKNKIYTNEKAIFQIDSQDPDGSIAEIRWKLHTFDSYRLATNKVEIFFPDSGSYVFQVEVEDDKGGVTYAKETIFVRENVMTPEVTIKAVGKMHNTEYEIVFSGKHKVKDSFLESIEWDFGDGETSKTNEPKVAHKFESSGNYEVSAVFKFDDGSSASTSLDIEINDHEKSVSTQANKQVVIHSYPVLELAIGEKIDLFYRVSDGLSGAVPTSYSCSVSNSNLTIVSCANNRIEVRAATSGDTDVTVTADGITSKPIAVKVLPYVNGMLVTQKTGYSGSNRMSFCVHLNIACEISYIFENNIDTNPAGIYYCDSTYNRLYRCNDIMVPINETAIKYTAVALSPSYSDVTFTKSNLQRFSGNGNFLRGLGGTELKITDNDSRFYQFDKDFSITYWGLGGNYGRLPNFIIDGNYYIEFGYTKAKLTADSGFNYNYYPDGETGDNKWVHVGITYKSSTRTVTLYYHGEVANSFVMPETTNVSTNTLKIDMGFYGTYDVGIDELRFWNKELTPTEVESEMFSPTPLSSTDLEASFSFDFGSGERALSDNNENWWIQFSDGDSNYPFLSTKTNATNLIDQTVTAGTQTNIEADIPTFGYGSGSFYIGINDNYLTADIDLKIDAIDCMFLCAEPNRAPFFLVNNRRSMFFNIQEFGNEVILMYMRIPVNFENLSEDEISRLKIIGWDASFSDYYIYEPSEVNLDKGYLGFTNSEGRVLWADVVDEEYLTKVEYTNTDLLTNWQHSQGYRTFYVDLPSSQSTYVLNTAESIGGSGISTNRNCSFSETYSLGTNTITIGNIPSGFSICDIFYKFYRSGAEINFVHKILFLKD